ncbi:UDP-N-acetylglucosamine--N-acetylmuramyl-(pentapeptide) pyrophosphoryl-undecaprenol N-acetylglucosamine transferase [Serinibacter salmoneus]|uniref:Glycosyl transferase family 28 C-terminal domain-containing protein n=1 Tax=Serinibacter salmoneus TaxID=556530 RepID=A0A2A9CWZ1_9MICO|nr:UDP-N-acetylglucosamine--N-acetylmuramyl-(pentapeptide) pyrophosphoryl-undecaprenol N-acetylglucosamine transferase [Serinibacter salmoneus]PFG18656.1 hypothetical protein ATL40_0199 [Serinibacter salmoneus]
MTRARRHIVPLLLLALSGLFLIAGLALASTTNEGAEVATILLVATGIAVILAALALAIVSAQRSVARMLQQHTRLLNEQIHTMRARQSRHEYAHTTRLAHIESMTETIRGDVEILHPPAAAPASPDLDSALHHEAAPRALFVTSNGHGMGHLSRCIAISRAGAGIIDPAILTLSTAYSAARGLGVPIEHFPSHGSSPLSREAWNRAFATHLDRTLTSQFPDVVVFDGPVVYRGVTQACRRRGIPLVWLRRGTWKADTDRTQYDSPHLAADHVLVPLEFFETDKDQAQAPTITHVSPITIMESFAQDERGRALAELGLPPAGQYALVQCGRSEVDGRSAAELAVDMILRETEYTPVVLESSVSLSAPNAGPNVRVLRNRYPISHLAAAFDFAVLAAGYNSVHEALATRLPSAFVPNTASQTDDQAMRARKARETNLGFCVESVTDLHRAILTLSSPTNRQTLGERLARLEAWDGAQAAAHTILRIASAQRRVGPPRGPTESLWASHTTSASKDRPDETAAHGHLSTSG